MNDVAATLARDCEVAMQAYLAGSGEAALRRAYLAGREALANGMGVLDILAAHQAPIIRELHSQVREQDSERAIEQAFHCLAESLSPFEMVFRGVQEANARLKQSLSSLRSVEEQLRRQNDELLAAHRAVEKERGRYQALYDFAPDGYLVTGLEGAILEANTAAAAILQTPKELLPGQSLSEFVVKADRAEFRERLRKLHIGSIEKMEDWQICIRPREGPPIPAALTVVAERSVPAVASLRWLIRDVTERKRLEKERDRWMFGRAKAHAARRFEILAEASSLLVGSPDVEANLISVARLAAPFFAGWCFISLVEPDGSLRQLEVAHANASAADLANNLRRHCLFGGPADRDRGALLAYPQLTEPLTDEWYDLAADGPQHSALLHELRGNSALVLPMRIHKRLVGVLTLISVVGARRPYRPAARALGEDLARRCALALENARLYREVVAERDKAEQASRAKDQFVAILSHELRNPLTPIVGWTRTLKCRTQISQDPVLAEGVKAIEKNALTLRRLIDDCLDLARISEGKIQTERKSVDLNQIVMTSAEAVRQMAAERELSLQVEVTAEPVPVLGDATRLEQVIMNLLINAVKYTKGGGSISIRTVWMGEETEVEITDTGIGIDPAYLEQIFEPFRQRTSSWLRSQSGLGLGLAIARRILEMHEGRIWAESAGLGRGSTFRVRLPLAAVEDQASAAGTVEQPPAAPGDSIRILLIEDLDDILFLMKTELEKMGHTVVTATDGHRGLEAARAHHPDLIISDIRMPVVDGYQLIRTIRDMPDLNTTPAIALTGFGAKKDIERALAAGFNGCLSKPAEPEEVAALLKQLIERRRAVHAGTQPG
jgi:PAS domain S-box-containing protein